MATQQKEKKSGGLLSAGFSLLSTAAVSIGTAMLLETKQGKKLVKQASAKAEELMNEMQRRYPDAQKYTKEKYAQLVDSMTEYYEKAGEITKREAPEVKKNLMKHWSMLSKQIKAATK